jgi:aspartate/methionine/tyrosine aminotransferase
MKTAYLDWYIDLEARLHRQTDCHILLASSIYEPTELLKKHLKDFHDRHFEKLIDVPDGGNHQILIDRIAERYVISADRITITRGVSNALYLICRTLLQNGDHVIIESPVYEPLVAVPDYIDTNITLLKRNPPDYSIDPNELKNAIRDNTGLVILTNPHNPSGALLTDKQLIEISGIVRSRNEKVKILVDEIYHDFVPGFKTPSALLDDCFITANSLTKVYGLGILHCGWIIADPATINKIKRYQVLTEGSGSRFLESLAALVIENLDTYLDRSLEIVAKNRELFCEHMDYLIEKDILSGRIPEYGCIYFPRINNSSDTTELAKSLAARHRIYVVPGHFFGEPAHLRIGFGGQPDKLKASLEKFTAVMVDININKSSF